MRGPMQKIRVVPTAGLRVRLPHRPAEFLPAEGAEVPATAFWRRRIREGAVALAAAPKRVKPVEKKEE